MWAKPDLTSISSLQLEQMTALLIVFVGTMFLCFLEELFKGSGVLVKRAPVLY
jgi:hypothetical protein